MKREKRISKRKKREKKKERRRRTLIIFWSFLLVFFEEFVFIDTSSHRQQLQISLFFWGTKINLKNSFFFPLQNLKEKLLLFFSSLLFSSSSSSSSSSKYNLIKKKPFPLQKHYHETANQTTPSQ